MANRIAGHPSTVHCSCRETFWARTPQMASRGLRTLCLSYVDFPLDDPARPADFFDQPSDDNLTAMCIVGIKVAPAAAPPCDAALPALPVGASVPGAPARTEGGNLWSRTAVPASWKTALSAPTPPRLRSGARFNRAIRCTPAPRRF